MKQNKFQATCERLINPYFVAALFIPMMSHAQIIVPPITLPQVTLPAGGKMPAATPILTQQSMTPVQVISPLPPGSSTSATTTQSAIATTGNALPPSLRPPGTAGPISATLLPAALNYQGFLTDQKTGAPVNGAVSVTFKFYDAPTAGNLLFTESQSLTAMNGVINARIGTVTAFPPTLAFDKPYWLELVVGSDTLTPRQALASAPFARSAGTLPSRVGDNTAVGDGALAVNAVYSPSHTANGPPLIGPITFGPGRLNTAVGFQALKSHGSGLNNIAIGAYSGAQLVSGDSNIYIGSVGEGVERGVIRIGTGDQTKAFLGGVRNTAPTYDNGRLVVIDSDGQLGTLPDVTLTSAGLSLGATTRQMLNLWTAEFGIGVQPNTLYYRSNSDFAWYKGGVHAQTAGDAGGGLKLMALNLQGLNVKGQVSGTTFNSTSDRNAKENFDNIDPTEVLAKVAKLPLQTWNYRNDDHKVKHIGPVAQDFQAAFNVGADDKHIASVDADGVALAAIQGLYRMVQDKDDALHAQSEEIERLKSDRAALLARFEKIEQNTQEKMAELEQRMEHLLAQGTSPKFVAVKY